MLTQSDIEREKYEARLKYQFDQNNWNNWYSNGLRLAEERGEERGKQRGEKIGLIHAFERILGRTATPNEQLSAMPLEDLAGFAAALEKQAIPRR